MRMTVRGSVLNGYGVRKSSRQLRDISRNSPHLARNAALHRAQESVNGICGNVIQPSAHR